MEVYAVGGSVRDELLGLAPQDHDYVVTGATPADMKLRGFEQVGSSFPVFLHPRTGEEYALARIERKTGPGYHGFSVNADPTVTIEDDLKRRDLTINSIAQHTKTGVLIDPYGGQRDLSLKILRHTSDAFAEDPLRVLRLARFAARFPDFEIADETLALCHKMVRYGELNQLSQERIWLETVKALRSTQPLRYFQVLQHIEAPQNVKGLSPLNTLFTYITETVLDHARRLPEEEQDSFAIAALIHFGRGDITQQEARGLPAGTTDKLAILTHDWRDMAPEAVLQRLVKVGALRKLWPKARQTLSILSGRVDLPLHDLLAGAANMVSAHAYPELEGAALGAALKEGRLNALRIVLDAYRKS